ncbi:MoxR-like ATPase [Caldanaerobius fijiensis DSM 17918]|uniref:MoxR-like ATPase n=1 Tax=Caldanaerobius fijiensis DSM 17918 TaxID=1121256 RepID=A0A1M5FEA0_9THEO|nr:MoxR family ATPase [Caldanaerobius fijiensis]SHF89884.1 MoxR-like ATPase [Caldanaerobius fijiensis DSM 17918]
MFDFKTREEVSEKLKEQGYISDKVIDYTIFNAVKLQAPLLIDGPAGVGKTEIAKVLAAIFDAELIRVQCYEGIDFSKVLYDFNYSKQLLYINLLKDNIGKLLQNKDFDTSVKLLNSETKFFGEDFLVERPILRAISPKDDKPKVLLIDEIDKSDMEFEALLLEVLSDFSVSIPEYGTVRAVNRPLVVLTSNNTRELSDALKRRCVYLYIDYPDVEKETKIIQTKVNIEYDFAKAIATAVQKIRSLPLKQKPSIAETINWAKVLLLTIDAVDFNSSNKEYIDTTLNVLLKNQNDIKKAQASQYIA